MILEHLVLFWPILLLAFLKEKKTLYKLKAKSTHKYWLLLSIAMVTVLCHRQRWRRPALAFTFGSNHRLPLSAVYQEQQFPAERFAILRKSNDKKGFLGCVSGWSWFQNVTDVRRTLGLFCIVYFYSVILYITAVLGSMYFWSWLAEN